MSIDYKVKFYTLDDQVKAYKENTELFYEKGNKSAATRARKALGEIGKFAKEQRKAIPNQDKPSKTSQSQSAKQSQT